MKVLLAVITGVLFLTSCSFQEDPLAGASPVVRGGHPEFGEKVRPPSPLPKDFLVIDAPKDLRVREGSVLEFTIGGRVLQPGISYAISLDNLPSFEGATFDKTTNVFRWTPPQGFSAGMPSREVYLEVLMVSERTLAYDSNFQSGNLKITVENDFGQPVIKTVKSNETGAYVGGRNYSFDFEIEDFDSTAREISITAHKCSLNRTLAPFINQNGLRADATVPGKFTGSFNLNLYDTTLLPAGQYCFGLVARSVAGVASAPYEITVTFQPKVQATQISTTVWPEITLGDSAMFSFSVADPSGNGELSMEAIDDLAAKVPGSYINCAPTTGNKSVIVCSGLLVTKDAQARKYVLNMRVKNTLGAQTVFTNHSISFDVKAITP